MPTTTVQAPELLKLSTDRGEFTVRSFDVDRPILGWYDATEPNPTWVYLDSHGHAHRYTTLHGQQVLTLSTVETYWCHDCRDDHDQYVCSQCGEDIDFSGSTRSIGQRPVRGLTNATIHVASRVDPGEYGELELPNGDRMAFARSTTSVNCTGRYRGEPEYEWRSIWSSVGAPEIAPHQGSSPTPHQSA